MAFPTYTSSDCRESATTTAGTSHTVTLPVNRVAGDLLVVLFSHAQAVTVNALDGWTELIDDGAANSIAVLYRYADGTEGTTITLTTASTKSASITYRFSGADHPTVTAPVISTVATGTSNAPDPGGCDPGTSRDHLWLTFFVNAGEEADDDTWCNNAATNYANLLQKTTAIALTATTNCSLASCTRTATASSEDAAWPSGSTDQSLAWRAWTVAIPPASAVYGAATLAASSGLTCVIPFAGPVRIGSVTEWQSGTSADTGSTTIDIPSDAEVILVGVSGFGAANLFTAGTLTIDSAVCTLEVAQGNDSTAGFQGALFGLDVRTHRGTGKSLAWDWSGTGGSARYYRFVYAFYKNADTSSPFKSSNGGQNASAPAYTAEGALSATSDDLLVCFAWCYADATTSGIAWTGATSIQNYYTRYENHCEAWAEGAPTGDVTPSVTAWTNAQDGGIAAVVLAKAAVVVDGSATLGSTSGLTAAAQATVLAIATLAGATGLIATADAPANATLDASSGMTASGTVEVHGGATLAAVSGLVAAGAVPGEPTLVQHVSSAANETTIFALETCDNYKLHFPNPVGSGNCLILGITYDYDNTITSISDDVNGTWPSATRTVTGSNGGGSGDRRSSVIVLPNAAAGNPVITVNLSGGNRNFQYEMSEFRDVATTSTAAGDAGTADDVGTALATGSFTPTNNDGTGGNLIWAYFCTSALGVTCPTNIAPGSGFSLLSADISGKDGKTMPHACEYYVQTASASINPALTVTGDTTDHWNCIAVALKAADAGTAPAAGIRIVNYTTMTPNTAPATMTIQFPTQGNLICLIFDTVANWTPPTFNSITDSNGNDVHAAGRERRRDHLAHDELDPVERPRHHPPLLHHELAALERLRLRHRGCQHGPVRRGGGRHRQRRR